MTDQIELIVLVPVLARPQNVAPLAASFLAARTVPSKLVFICSRDDHDEIRACAAVAEVNSVGFDVVDWMPGPGDFARKINHGFRRSTAPFVFQAADDVEFESGWDREVLFVAYNTGKGVVGTDDRANATVMRGDNATHLLLRRTYVDDPGAAWGEPGVVFHEGYGHQYVDTECVAVAKHRGEWVFASRAVVRHRHPFWHTAPNDDTYRKGQSTAAADRRLFNERSRLWKENRQP